MGPTSHKCLFANNSNTLNYFCHVLVQLREGERAEAKEALLEDPAVGRRLGHGHDGHEEDPKEEMAT